MQRLAHCAVHNGDVLRIQFSKCRARATRSIAFMECQRGADRVAVRRFSGYSAMALPTWSSLRPHCHQLAADQPFVGRSNSALRHHVPRTTHAEDGYCPDADRDLAAASMVALKTGE